MKKHISQRKKRYKRLRSVLRSHALHAHKAHRSKIDTLKEQWSQHIHSLHSRHHQPLHAAFHHMHTAVAYIEYAMILFTGLFGLLSLPSFASQGTIDIQDRLQYPFEQISTVECRTTHRDDIRPEDECIIDMPRIRNLEYTKYNENTEYRQFYTVLWGARYQGDTRIQDGPQAGAHAGVDMATSQGTPLYAIGDSTVIFAGERAGWGRVVISMMEYNEEIYEVIYAHMDEIHVRSGDTLSRGEYIGTVGNTGMTFGALGGFHLHLQINKGDTYSYLGCDSDDLAKGHMYIINNGKCREALKANTVDPLVLIENSLLSYEQQFTTDNTVQPDSDNTNTVESNRYQAISVVAGTRYDHIADSLATHNSPDATPDRTADISSHHTNEDRPSTIHTESHPVYSSTLEVEVIEPSPLTLPSQVRQRVQTYTMDTRLEPKGDKHILHIQFIHRNTGKEYTGVLPVPLRLITSSPHVQVSDSYITSIPLGGVRIALQIPGQEGLIGLMDTHTVLRVQSP